MRAAPERDVEALPYPEARGRLFEAIGPLADETVALEQAHGRALSRAVKARADLMPYSRSAMDGFAVRACDVTRVPVALAVVKSIYASPGDDSHLPGTATAIATGAPLPHGADTVIPIEDVDVRGTTITVGLPIDVADNVFPPAQDARSGDRIVAAGERLGPGSLGLLAADGHARVTVTRRPRVAIVCTGDELVTPGVEPVRGQVRNSNGIMLAASARECGAEVVAQGSAPDRLATIATTIEGLLPDVDALVMSGGASLGPRDFTKAALRQLGAQWLFASAAIRPGRPAAVALVDRKPVFVLPGNPAAAFVAATVFLLPALRRMGGLRQIEPPALRARLTAGVRAKAGRHSFIFARLYYGDVLAVEPLANQCSSLIRTAADADALVVLDPGAGQIAAGEMVTVRPRACAFL